MTKQFFALNVLKRRAPDAQGLFIHMYLPIQKVFLRVTVSSRKRSISSLIIGIFIVTKRQRGKDLKRELKLSYEEGKWTTGVEKELKGKSGKKGRRERIKNDMIHWVSNIDTYPGKASENRKIPPGKEFNMYFVTPVQLERAPL